MIDKLSKNLKSILGDSYLYYLIYRLIYFLKVFFVLKPNISRSFNSETIPIKTIQQPRPKIIVPILETNHNLNFHILAMAKAFTLRGYDVVVIICDEYLPACEIKSCRTTSKMNPCFACNVKRRHLLDIFNLEYLTLSEIFSDIENPEDYGKKILIDYLIDKNSFDITIEDSVTRHFYGDEFSYDDAEVNKVREAHTKTAYMSLLLGEILFKRYSPEIIFNSMMTYSAWGPLFNFFEHNGVAPITLSMTHFDFNSIRLNNFSIFRNKNIYNRFLKDRGHKALTQDEDIDLNSFLDNRIQGNDDLAKEWDFFQNSSMSDLGIKKNKKNVFLFTNIPWDTGLNEFAGPFEDVLDWVNKTIEHFSDNKEIDIWIKTHPAEVRGPSKSSKTVSEYIKTNYPDLPKNIHVINADTGINTYNLFKYIDLGVVLTGTLGLEMALEDIPVISAGISPCYGLGILSEPNSVESYFEAIKSGKNLITKKNELRLFCYFYFIHQCFRWPLTKRSFGDDFTGYEFTSINALQAGQIKDLDIIFDEIENLVEDFKANHKK